jgi:hypothetical protein
MIGLSRINNIKQYFSDDHPSYENLWKNYKDR